MSGLENHRRREFSEKLSKFTSVEDYIKTVDSQNFDEKIAWMLEYPDGEPVAIKNTEILPPLPPSKPKLINRPPGWKKRQRKKNR